jgi:hypothetical protein
MRYLLPKTRYSIVYVLNSLRTLIYNLCSEFTRQDLFIT